MKQILKTLTGMTGVFIFIFAIFVADIYYHGLQNVLIMAGSILFFMLNFVIRYYMVIPEDFILAAAIATTIIMNQVLIKGNYSWELFLSCYLFAYSCAFIKWYLGKKLKNTVCVIVLTLILSYLFLFIIIWVKIS